MSENNKLMDTSGTSKRKLLPFVPDTPYSIQIVFIISFGYIFYTAFKDDYNAPYPTDQAAKDIINRANWISGFTSCTVFMCAFAFIRPADYAYFAPMQRFWRIITMLAQIYMCFNLIMLHHRPEYGRELLQYIDPSLKRDLTEDFHTYDDDCELTWANFGSNFDHYYVVHLANWFLSSFTIRDAWILHSWHVIDELIELSWQHILPHFRECWWDHIFCDILLSNIPAITFGLWLQTKIGLVRYDFLGKDGKKSVWDWDMFHCHKRFGVFFYIQILLHIFFINNFFQINNFLIPPIHFFPICRLLLWFAIGSLGFREGYEDCKSWNTIERKHTPVEGRFRWLSVAILSTEMLSCWKYRNNTGHIQHDAHTPFYIWGPWFFFYAGMAIFWVFLRFKPGHTIKYPVNNKVKSV